MYLFLIQHGEAKSEKEDPARFDHLGGAALINAGLLGATLGRFPLQRVERLKEGLRTASTIRSKPDTSLVSWKWNYCIVSQETSPGTKWYLSSVHLFTLLPKDTMADKMRTSPMINSCQLYEEGTNAAIHL